MRRACLIFIFSFLLPAYLPAEPFVLTDTQGRSITAEVLSVANDKVKIKRSDGQTFELPLSSLSTEDQLKLKAWAASNKPSLGPNALTLEFSRAKFDSDKQSLDGGAITAYKDHWGYSITLTNRSNQELTGIRVEYRLFVKQNDGLGTRKNQEMRKISHSTKPDPIPLHERINFRTETVVSYRYALKPGYVWGETNNNKQIRDTLYGIWMRIYVGDELITEKISPEDLTKTEKW